MMNDTSIIETDAVHHRLSNEVNLLTSLPYGCYDCTQLFVGLEELAQHSLTNPHHSEEICLKCKSSIIVFYKHGNPVRLHSCKKIDVCHLHPDLYLHSQFIFSKLNSLLKIPGHTIVGCDIQSCEASFEFSIDGLFKFLKHANKRKHTTVPSCRKCALPEFQLTVGGMKTISHYCAKIGKIVFISKPLLTVSSS